MECLKLNSAKDSANARLRLMTQQKMDADRQRDDMKYGAPCCAVLQLCCINTCRLQHVS